MLTHILKSINWIDVGMCLLFIRVVFVGIKSGFIAEFFKSLGIVIAVFVSFHYYSYVAALAAQKTGFIWAYWEFVVFALLWFAVCFFFKFVREGIFFLFKLETNHEGFDKYASGIVAVLRGILVCSMTMFLILLTYNGRVTRMTFHSYSFKLAGRAAVGTYGFLYKQLVDKFVTGEHYNKAPALVLQPAR